MTKKLAQKCSEGNTITSEPKFKARCYCFTLNNYTDKDLENIKAIDCLYLIVGQEVGKKGTKHLQGYIRFKNARAFKSIKKLISNRCHLEKARGNDMENREYCSKEGKFFEKGECAKQGKRSDLESVKNEILNGLKVTQILEEDPVSYHQYGRTMEKLEDLYLSKQYRSKMTKGTWYYGGTGTGKSHVAFEGFHPDTHYLWNLRDNGWQDQYKGQKIVVINDFRGEIPYNDLLNMVDKWPLTIPRRGRPPIPFISEEVIITSSLKPSKVYNRRIKEDSLQQLKRRFNIIKLEPWWMRINLFEHDFDDESSP